MSILKFKRIIAKILVISIIFTSLCVNNTNIVFAAGLTAEQRAEMESNIQSWLRSNVNHKIIREEYNDKGEDKVIYAVDLPTVNSANNADYSMIRYDSSSGKYIYQITDSNGDITNYPFNVDVAIANSTTGFPNGLTPENYNQYTDATLIDSVLATEDGRLIKIVDLDSEVQRPMAYIVEMEDGQTFISDIETFSFDNGSLGERILNGLKNGFFDLWDIAMNALAKIFNSLLLWIADGIHDLIDSIFGSDEKITIYKVIFGKIDKLSINYWETTPISEVDEEVLLDASGVVGNPPASALKNIVSYWYGVLRNIVISIYLVMLLYIGIKILLASTGSSAQKYKSMLTSWLVGLIIVCFYPYAMQYTVVLNDMFVEMIESSASEISEDDNEDTMYQVRMQAEDQRSLPLTIVYIIMLGQLIVLLGVYYKRIFMMAFLITIFPIVAGLYVWESVNKGKASALGAWTREYVVLVFVQTFHAVIYVVLIDGAYAAFKADNDWFIFMISVIFLFEGEKIIRAIFNVKSSANTIGDLAAAGATAWGVSKAAKSIFKSNGSSKSKDEKDKDEADEEVENARRTTAVNNAMAQRQASMPQSNTNALPPSGGQPSQPQSQATPTLLPTSEPNQMANIEAAKAVVKQEALRLRTKKGIVQSALNKATEGVARAAGITLGLTSGLASGSLKDGIANAVVANEVASAGAKLVNNITGYAFGAYAGMRLKRKIRNGELNDKFKAVGFDLDGKFDEDAEISKAKARVIQEALAAQGAATRRGGKEKGELKFIDAVEKGRRKENL